MTKEQALDAFWQGFGLDAYDESSVPDKKPGTDEPLEPPYITYNVATDSLSDYGTALTASLWYHGTSWAEITDKSNTISQYIGFGGVTIPYEGGYLWIRRGSPFAQRMSDPENDLIRRIVLNVEAEFLSVN